MSLLQIATQKLLDSKAKGFDIKFKTNDEKYFIYIGGSLYVTMNKSQFDKFFENWNLVNSLAKSK